MEINKQKLLDLFFDLVKIDATSKDERALADFIKHFLEQRNIEAYEDNAGKIIGGNCGNIIAKFGNEHDETFLLGAHMDTVSSTKGVKPVIVDRTIRSSGDTILGADNRAGVAVILYALDEITSNQKKTKNLEIVFSVAEELGMLGVEALDFSILKSRYGYILDCSGLAGSYVQTTPTAIDLDIDFHGKAAHSGVSPEKGVNALSMALKVLAGFPVGRVNEKTLANIGIIHGGEATNVVPDLVSVKGEIRSFERADIETILEKTIKCCRETEKEFGGKIDLKTKTGFEGFELGSGVAAKHLENELRAMGIGPNPLVYYGGSDANVYNAKGIQTVNIGIGAQNPHSPSEYIHIDDMVAGAELILRLAGDF